MEILWPQVIKIHGCCLSEPSTNCSFQPDQLPVILARVLGLGKAKLDGRGVWVGGRVGTVSCSHPGLGWAGAEPSLGTCPTHLSPLTIVDGASPHFL